MRKMATDDSAPSVPDVKVAVIGTGSLGKEHVRIYSELAAAQKVRFVGVYDVVADTARRFAQSYGVRAFSSVEEAAQASDALSIVTPTTTHFDLAKIAHLKSRHLFVAKT